VAPVTARIKAISCFAFCFLLTFFCFLISNGDWGCCASAAVDMIARLRGSRVVLSSKAPGERRGPRKAVGKESKLLLSHINPTPADVSKRLRFHTFVHASSVTTMCSERAPKHAHSYAE